MEAITAYVVINTASVSDTTGRIRIPVVYATAAMERADHRSLSVSRRSSFIASEDAGSSTTDVEEQLEIVDTPECITCS